MPQEDEELTSAFSLVGETTDEEAGPLENEEPTSGLSTMAKTAGEEAKPPPISITAKTRARPGHPLGLTPADGSHTHGSLGALLEQSPAERPTAGTGVTHLEIADLIGRRAAAKTPSVGI